MLRYRISQKSTELFPAITRADIKYQQISLPACKIVSNVSFLIQSVFTPKAVIDVEECPVILGVFEVSFYVSLPTGQPILHVSYGQDEFAIRVGEIQIAVEEVAGKIGEKYMIKSVQRGFPTALIGFDNFCDSG